MRKRTIRNGLRLVFVALAFIIVVSFYIGTLGNFLSLSLENELLMYRLGIFLAAAMGGYGVVLTAFGFVLQSDKRDADARVMPVFFLILAAVSLFFYLLAASFDSPLSPRQERLRPGESITI